MKYLRFVSGLFVAVLLVAAPVSLRAQSPYGSTANSFTLTNPFASTINAGAVSNQLYFGAAGLNVSSTAAAIKRAPYLGIDLTFSGSTTTTAPNSQIAIAVLPSSDGGITFAQNALWFVVPAGIGVTNIYARTNFSAAVLANATHLRIAAITNNNATALVVSNSGVKVNYTY